MLESTKAGLKVFVSPTKLVGDVAVGMCFALECNGCSLNRLTGQSECTSSCFPAGAEEAALGYSLYLAVQQVLCGDPLAVSKTKVAAVECVAHNGMLGVNWKVKGTGSAIRKSIGLALRVLDPAKMWPAYSRCVKYLGGPVNKDVFASVADAAAKSIKSNLQVSIVGNVKLDQKKLDDIVEVLAKKHEVSDVKGSKSKPTGHTACDHSELAEIKVSGWQSAVVADYLRSKVRGLTMTLCDKSLLLPMKSAQLDTITKKLKAGVKEYAKAKYAKVGADLPAVFGYLTLSSGTLCASDVKSAISNKLSVDAIEAALDKHL
jgi:hypothetical protein